MRMQLAMFRASLISMFLTSTALADTWTVDDDGKADFGNIQAAIDAASDGDEIVVMPGTYTSSSISVFTPLGKELWIHSSNGASKTFIDGEGLRHGILLNNEETNKTIIEGFSLINCSGIVGGGIYCNYSSPKIEGCLFESNSAIYGGGFYCLGGNPILISCSFNNNSAGVDDLSGGGGMFFTLSNPTILQCSITNNSATNGGGIYCQASTPVIENCSFDNNSSYCSDINPEYSGRGGGMYCKFNNSATITNCTFTSNSAPSYGGAVYCLDNSDLLMTNCTFTSNVAPNGGGGICNKDNGELILGNCTFSANNSGDGFGAGIYCWRSEATLTDCVFELNTASSCAGICFYGTTLDLYSCTFINNAALEDSGAIFCAGGSSIIDSVILTIDNCEFKSNAAYGNNSRGYGGAISFYGLDDSCRYTISNSSFQNNSANLLGGAIELALWSENADGTISNCLFSNNSSEFGGGAIYHDLYSSNEPRNVVTDTIFCSNFPNHIYGPWINGGGNCLGFSCEDSNDDGTPDECSEDADFLLHVPEEYSTIQSAVMAAGPGAEIIVGPGVYTNEYFSVINTGGKELWIHSSYGPEATIINGEGMRAGIRCVNGETSKTIIEGFTITGGYDINYGGGMWCSFSDPTILNCIFTNNSSGSGGGMFNEYSSPILENCIFSNNIATEYVGGGMRNYHSSPTLTNCAFTKNSTVHYGGGMSNLASNSTLIDCTFTGNDAINGGGGIASISDGVITLFNCTFSNNIAKLEGGGMWNSNSSTLITACEIRNNTAQAGGGMKCDTSSTLVDTVVCGNSPDQVDGAYADGGGNIIDEACASECHDIDGDGIVDVIDLIAIIAAWNCQNCFAEDLDGNGIVDISDLLIICGNWGPCP